MYLLKQGVTSRGNWEQAGQIKEKSLYFPLIFFYNLKLLKKMSVSEKRKKASNTMNYCQNSFKRPRPSPLSPLLGWSTRHAPLCSGRAPLFHLQCFHLLNGGRVGSTDLLRALGSKCVTGLLCSLQKETTVRSVLAPVCEQGSSPLKNRDRKTV